MRIYSTILLILAGLLFARPTHAYLDPSLPGTVFGALAVILPAILTFLAFLFRPIKKLIKYIAAVLKFNQKPKVITIAAGMGKRLNSLTRDMPKCLLEIEGKTIMERQLETLGLCGIKDASVIRGYQRDKISFPGIKYYENTNYQNNDILNSLFYAEKEMQGEFIVSYSDILYDKKVIEKLLKNKNDIAIVVDTDWQESYRERTKHPIEEAENVIIKNGKVVQIGKCITVDKANGEFIGMAKFSKKGGEIFKKEFQRVKNQYRGKSFQGSETFEKAYLTDMLQELIDSGYNIYPTLIQKNWWEIDTEEDLEKVRNIFKGRRE